jgi:threonyl-tRNA synthetase
MSISVFVKGIPHQLNAGATGINLAEVLGKTAPEEALALRISGTLFDLSRPLIEGDEVEIVNFSDPEGKQLFWHTSAHILAQAVLRLWPQAKPTIGPAIAEGFYYDFADLHVSEEDFPKIEEEVKKIIRENFKPIREEFTSRAAAIEAFKSNPYKKELLESFEEQTFSAYRQGDFFDLCRGPHLPFLGKVKAFKIMKTSGAYWHGDPTKEMLTRIYAISFPDRKMLLDYLHFIEEAKKRDHRVLGTKLGLFSHSELAAGMAFIHAAGMRIWNALLKYWREEHERAGYVEIKTPTMMARELWECSGHWQNYRHNMYTSTIDDHIFAIKPMNCPGCMLYFKMGVHSYREFPLRVAEIGHVHRHEASGALSGLFRVRSFHQDDAHIFLESHQIEEEILNILRLVDKLYATFGLDYNVELSTRPDKETIGSDEQWELATAALRSALDRSGKPYAIREGDGAFYGPKIDLHIRDCLNRTWQCGTIQLDMALPERFELEYVNNKGDRVRPVMLHRALFGSIERFLGILIEHFAGRFPLWLSPRQIRILPVADRHIDYAHTIQKELAEAGFFVEVDSSHESVSKKVRLSQIEQVNYMLTLGDQETNTQTISVRTRDNIQKNEMQLSEFVNLIKKENAERALSSCFSNSLSAK